MKQFLENAPVNTDQKKESIYKHEEFGNLEEDACSLVRKLKDKIDQGFYDILVSDETGGRLPTLLMRAIIKKRNPQAKIQTLFINGGKMLRDVVDDGRDEKEFESFVDYLKFVTEDHQNALVVTQVMRSGTSVALLASMLSESGCDHVDVATVRARYAEPIYQEDKNRIEGEVFYGRESNYTDEFDDKNTELSGVSKVERNVVHPSTVRNILMEKDPEEINKIQTVINEAREDVNTMADRICKEVWMD
jgi:hypothetical protein